MDTKIIRQMALNVASQIEGSGEVKAQWAPWALAQQVNQMIDLAAQAGGDEIRPFLPAKFRQSMRPNLAAARYVDVAIAASQVASLLQPAKLRKKTA